MAYHENQVHNKKNMKLSNTAHYSVRWLVIPLFLCLPLFAIAADKAEASAPRSEASDSARQEMNKLANRAFELALGAIKESGGVYPFALVSDGKNIRTITRNPKEKAPPQEKWFSQLSGRAREAVKEQKKALVAALVRMHSIKNEKEKKTQGIWTLVDHKDYRPWVAFMPLIKQKNGKHKRGEIIYYATEEWIFPKREN